MSPFLRASRNVWRIERANRAAVLLDGGHYFGALRQALLNARSSVFIVGWDLDSRTPLVGESGQPDDGLPREFIAFLSELVKRRPRLRIHLLVWDYSVLYSLERELFPLVAMRWRTPRGIRYCLDDNLPLGASHHQKIVVIDDAIAFSGGLDITIRRWDTREHHASHPMRTDPDGMPYPPFHDVQALVDGPAAKALAELVRRRWARGACERPSRIRPVGNPWPQDIAPMLTDIPVGIARTFPSADDKPDIREVEALFLDSIDRAERTIYIENQFFTAGRFAEHLAAHLRHKPDVEVVMIGPKAAHSWLEAQTMQAGLERFMHTFAAEDLRDRISLLCPEVTSDAGSTSTMIHSKVMIVDDVLLRVGSANLNNRSFGLDSECDLAFEGETAEHRRAILDIRNHMLGHFCGVGAAEVAQSLAVTGSLIATAKALEHDGHRLVPIRISGESPARSALEAVADPEAPITAPAFLETFVGRRPPARRVGRLGKFIAACLSVLVLVAVWRFTPLSALLRPTTIRDALESIAGLPLSPVIVLSVFVVAGLVAFPVTLLIAATAAAFGPWLGFVYAALGSLLSAIVAYGVGALLGRRALERYLGPRLNRIRYNISRHGLLAVITMRIVPIAPFTLVNLVAGASRIRFTDYVGGTIIGMAPGLVMMSALGHQIFSIITSPTPLNVALLLLAIVGWIAVSLGAQALALRSRRFQA
jgi:phospholipase D1/2